MREPVDAARIRRLLEALGRAAERDVRVYLVGGTTAVLMGWRASTIDVDFVMRPEDDAVLRAIPALKERLAMNVELASPADFIPLPAGWEERGTFVGRFGRIDAYHFDLYAQALANSEGAPLACDERDEHPDDHDRDRTDDVVPEERHVRRPEVHRRHRRHPRDQSQERA